MKFIPLEPTRSLYAIDGITSVGLVSGSPASVDIPDSGIDAWALLAFTPDAPTVTFGYDGAPEFLGAQPITPRVNGWRGTAMATVKQLRVWAKRKPDTTGAIRAQTITLQGHDGSSYVTVGKITIGATAAGTDEPVADWLDITRLAGTDARLNFGNANPFKFISSLSTITGGQIEADDNIYTKTSHGLATGDAVSLTSLTGGTGLTAGQLYWFHKLTDNTGYLCVSLANALAGTAINVTLDASSVVLTPVDANLEIILEAAGTAA